ncbi:MAG: two pore domain potassium channel family protein [Aureispira sp.]|nr:two pore domain potassium channel family protein [Aureispira sp.]
MAIIFDMFRGLKDRFSHWDRKNVFDHKNDQPRQRSFRNKLNFTSQVRKYRPLRWLFILIGWFLLLMVIYSLGVMYLEPEAYPTWTSAIWQSWQTFTTVGYGDNAPSSPLGKWLTIILSTIGIAIVGALFSAAFDYKIFLGELKQAGFMNNPFKDGYVIFNAPDTHLLLNFICELRDVEPEAKICIVDNRMDKLPKSLSILDNIHFIRGNTLSKATYEQAHLKENKIVLVFPQETAVAGSDGSTKTTVDLISKFVTEKTRIIHILVNPSNKWMFDNVRSTSISEGFELLALIQECQDQYSAQIIEDLLMNTRGANPKTVVPKHILGWTWGQFVSNALKVSHRTGELCTPLALVKNGETYTCPKLEESIDKDTLISIITYNDFNWQNFERDLAKSFARTKTLFGNEG